MFNCLKFNAARPFHLLGLVICICFGNDARQVGWPDGQQGRLGRGFLGGGDERPPVAAHDPQHVPGAHRGARGLPEAPSGSCQAAQGGRPGLAAKARGRRYPGTAVAAGAAVPEGLPGPRPEGRPAGAAAGDRPRRKSL
eukprot:scaffold642765_cov52-Prasinocladus_malaysianus.AAC.1